MYTVLKEVHSDTGMSSKAMSFMDSFMNDVLDRISTEANHLAQNDGRKMPGCLDLVGSAPHRLRNPGSFPANMLPFMPTQSLQVHSWKKIMQKRSVAKA
ncbi:hypothetical protein M513_11465 [Trichuris suis]|uniref:Core Histone H2A/H2B/H3 domain-containing protein n=1 Tax=Trichuris suis TaxID=68888 RepID=A0A085LRS8_9BILA|nr:hypothetical protein M513_11465 [Trichuris suis]